ncbi:MAG: AMP-binding protein [Halieaceae bacterium]|jgi:acyl-CoA synthetase (AMP-forming)/AMP-acid ligase II|nr:AMP-binding protein [Halieaceae bacterium]
MDSVYQCFCDTAARYPEADFLHIPRAAARHYSDSCIELTYGEALAAIEQLRSAYQRSAYGPGHRVALLLQNRAEFLLHWIALNGLGTSVVPINDEMSAEEQAYIINHSEASVLLYLPDLADKVALLRPLLAAGMAYQSTADTAAPCNPGRATGSSTAVTLQAECAVLYTSGSTGKPKGCLLSNEYFLLSGQRYVELGGLCELQAGSERLITPLPLVHMNAMACSTIAMIMSGGCLIQLDRFHPRSWWQTVRDSRASVLHYLGVMPAMLLGMDPLAGPQGDDFSGQVKFAFGAGVNPRHHGAFEQRFGFPLVEAWGMTETGNHGAIIANREPRHVGSCCFGVPPDHLEVKLVDEAGEAVAVGEPGELLLRHVGENPRRGFFSAYLKNPGATDEAWEQGWFHTGDVVRRDAGGAMYFVDRRKNVIRRSGENISALEVEAVLAGNPAITMAVVCPVPDDIRGDEVMACIIPAAGTASDQQTAEAIAQRALHDLAYFKIPGYITFAGSLPLTASEKPRRGEIKTLAVARLQAGECYDVRHLKQRQKT